MIYLNQNLNNHFSEIYPDGENKGQFISKKYKNFSNILLNSNLRLFSIVWNYFTIILKFEKFFAMIQIKITYRKYGKQNDYFTFNYIYHIF